MQDGLPGHLPSCTFPSAYLLDTFFISVNNLVDDKVF